MEKSWSKMWALVPFYIYIIADAVQVYVILPFIVVFVRSLRPTSDPRQLGTYVGLLQSSYYLGQFITTTIAGFLSDRVGRKPLLLVACLATAVTTLVFGLSDSYWEAVVFRTLAGCSAYAVGITRAVTSDVTNDKTQALGFALLNAIKASGGIIGPLIGGYLANYVAQHPTSILGSVGVFVSYPYFLPCLVAALLQFVAFFVVLLLFDETHAKKKKIDNPQPKEEEKVFVTTTTSDKDVVGLLENRTQQQNDDEEEPPTEETPLLPKEEEVAKSQTQVWTGCVLVCISISFVHTVVHLMDQQLVIVWASNPIEYHGLGFGPSEIGNMQMLSATTGLILTPVLFPPLERKLGALYTFRLLTVVFGIICYSWTFFSPSSPETPKSTTIPTTHSSRLVLSTVMVYVFWCLRSLVVGFLYSVIGVLLSNSSHPRNRGTVQSLSSSLGALLRTFGPAVSGLVFSWSQTNGLPWPLDWRFAFEFDAALCLANLCLSLYLTRQLDKRRLS